MKAVNRLFPEVNLALEDVEAAWAGLRPLIHKEGKSPSELSRKDEVFVSKSGLISIAGGKLTGYRIMSKKIVNQVMRSLHKSHQYKHVKCLTKNIKLSGGEFELEPTLKNMSEYLDNQFDEAKQTGIQPPEFKNLFYRYGTNTSVITHKAYDYYNETRDTNQAWLMAEIWYAIEHEMVISLEDFFIRRTEQLYFDKEKCIEILEKTAEVMKVMLAWTEDKKTEELEKFKQNLTFIV